MKREGGYSRGPQKRLVECNRSSRREGTMEGSTVCDGRRDVRGRSRCCLLRLKNVWLCTQATLLQCMPGKQGKRVCVF